MKKIKRLLALILIFTLVMSTATQAFAAKGGKGKPDDGGGGTTDPPETTDIAINLDTELPQLINVGETINFTLSVNDDVRKGIEWTSSSNNVTLEGRLKTTQNFTYTSQEGVDEAVTITYNSPNGSDRIDLVFNFNEAPVITGAYEITIDEDGVGTVNIVASDEEQAENQLTYSLLNYEGSANIVNTEATFTYTPAPDFNGTDSFTVKVSDGYGGTATTNVKVTIDAINDAPVANADITSAKPGQTIFIDVLSNDTDVDGDSLTVSLSENTPQDAPYKVVNNQIEFTATGEGTYDFTYNVSDGFLTDTGSVQVVVKDEVVYVALGDSIPFGTLGTGKVGTNYTQQFADMLGSVEGESYVNRGVSGYNAEDVLDILNGIYDAEYAESEWPQDVVAWVENADVITLCIGANDIMDAAPRTGFGGTLDKYNVNWEEAELGRDNFELYWSQIINKIEDMNPDVTLITMTIYNPYHTSESIYSQVDEFFTSEVEGDFGLNYIIQNTERFYGSDWDSRFTYKVADVYSAFNQHTNKDSLTDFYNSLLGIPLCDPHPTQSGHNLIYSIHADTYN